MKFQETAPPSLRNGTSLPEKRHLCTDHAAPLFEEMRVCILLLSGFKIADIAILLDCSPQSITNIKARANNKLFAENSAATLEKNLIKTVGLPQT